MGRKPQDLTGRQFGLLTAMYPTEQRDKRGSVYWHCVCECGNTIDSEKQPKLRMSEGQKSERDCRTQTSGGWNLRGNLRKEKKEKR